MGVSTIVETPLTCRKRHTHLLKKQTNPTTAQSTKQTLIYPISPYLPVFELLLEEGCRNLVLSLVRLDLLGRAVDALGLELLKGRTTAVLFLYM